MNRLPEVSVTGEEVKIVILFENFFYFHDKKQ